MTENQRIYGGCASVLGALDRRPETTGSIDLFDAIVALQATLERADGTVDGVLPVDPVPGDQGDRPRSQIDLWARGAKNAIRKAAAVLLAVAAAVQVAEAQSLPRIALGTAIAASGAAVLYSRPAHCRITGALSADDLVEHATTFVQEETWGSFTVEGYWVKRNARAPVTRRLQSCALTWTVDSFALSRTVFGDFWQDLGPLDDFYDQRMQGTLQAGLHKPRGTRFYVGLGMIGTGVLVALWPAGEDAPVAVDVGPDRVSASLKVGW